MKGLPKRMLVFLLGVAVLLGAVPVPPVKVLATEAADTVSANILAEDQQERDTGLGGGSEEVPSPKEATIQSETTGDTTESASDTTVQVGQPLKLSTDSYYIIYDAFDENGNALDAKSGNSRILFDNGGNNEGWLKYGSSYTRDYNSKYFWKLEEGEQEGTYHMRSQGFASAFAVLAQGARANGGEWVISEKNPKHKGSPMKFEVMAQEEGKTYVAIKSVPYTDSQYGELTAEKYMTTEDFAMTETTDETSVRCYVQWTDTVSAEDRTKGWWVIEEVMGKDETMPGGVEGRSLLFRTEPMQYHYRIPAVVTNNEGELVVVSDYRYDSYVDIGTNWGGWNGTDYSGYGNKGHRIDLVRKYSTNNGESWSEEKNLTNTYSYHHDSGTGRLANGYGDPAVVADRESDKVFVMSVGGSYGFMQQNAGVVSMLSTDGGKTFTEPKVEGGRATSTEINETTGIYALGKDIGWDSLFFSSGRIMQSRYIKVGDSYRIYTAALVRHKAGGNYNHVFYSDDFGTTWKVLPGAAISGADEAKIDELPNGSVVITSRKGGGRKVNVFTYDRTDENLATGSWGTQADMNVGRSTNGTNGELYIVYAKTPDNNYGYLALQSLPAAANGQRQEVRIFYKWIDASVDTPQEFASGWSIENSYVLQESWSAYSVMSLQNDGKIAAVWEENNNQWDIVYAGIDISTLTGGKYLPAFTKGIGSAKNPFEVSTEEQANAVNSVYRNEKVNWNFTGEAQGKENQIVTYTYELNTSDQVNAGDEFVIVFDNQGEKRQLHFHDDNGTNIMDVIGGNISGTSLSLSGSFPEARQVWKAVAHDNGLALKNNIGSYYMDLSQNNTTRAQFAQTPVKVIIEPKEGGDNTFIIKEAGGNKKLAYNTSNRKFIVTDDEAYEPVAVHLYKKTAHVEEVFERPEGSTEIPTSEMIMSAGNIQPNGSSEGDARFAIDGDNTTLWHTNYNGSERDTHWIQVKLKSDYQVDGLKVIPRQTGTNGMITQYEIQVSTDKQQWTTVKEGSWEANAQPKEVYFKPTEAKYVRLYAKNALPETGTLFASLAELRLTGIKTGDSKPVVPTPDDRELLTLSEDKFYLIYDAFDAQGNPLNGTSTDSKTMFDNGGDSEGYLKVNGNFAYNDMFSSSYLWSMEESEYEGGYYMRSSHADNALGVLAENARDITGRNVVSEKDVNHKGSPMKFVVMQEEGDKKYVAIQSLAYTDETYGDLTDESYMTADAGGEFVQWTDEVNAENKNGWWVVEEVMGKEEPIPVGVEGRKLIWRTLPLNYHYRIPAIGTNNAGELISVADYRYFNQVDIGLGWGGWNGRNWGGFPSGHRIDLVSKVSKDQGVSWSEERNHTKHLSYEGTSNPYKQANGYGDPSVVGDRESDKVLVLAVGGGRGFLNEKAGIISMLSTDGGNTFADPVGVGGSLEVESVPEGVTDAYDLQEGDEWLSMFITSGRITQSRYIKVKDDYRIYVAPLIRTANGNVNFVFYSDDFGKNWAALPGKAITGADEAKVEELPNGSVVITSRKGSGRYVNVFTYEEGDETYTRGSWGTQAEFNVGSTRGTNGDLYITYAKNQQGEYGYVAIQTLPTYRDASRKDVRIAYKWLDANTSTPQQFAEGWSMDNTYQLQPTHSAYSAMTLQTDGTFGFLWEENDNAYDIAFKSLSLSEITQGKYVAAFGEGIGSVKSPFVVETVEQAQAIEGVYAREKMNWSFVGEARDYMNEKYPGQFEELEIEASLSMDKNAGLRIRAWEKGASVSRMEVQITQNFDSRESETTDPVSMSSVGNYYTYYLALDKEATSVSVRISAYNEEGKSTVKELSLEGFNTETEAVNDLWIRFLDGYGEENKNYVYTGSAIKPRVQVYEGTTLLTEKKDYTISYKNNTNAGKQAEVVIKGKGNYKGSEKANFTIVPKSLSNEDQAPTLNMVEVANVAAVVKKTEQRPVPVITYGKKKLSNKKNKDFTVSYPDEGQGAYKEAGTYRIVIEGQGNYQGTREITFTIGSKLMSKMKVSKISKQPYTGSEITIDDLVVSDGKTELVCQTDSNAGGETVSGNGSTPAANYKVEYFNNIEIGKATIVITGIDGVYAGSKIVSFNITGTPISKAKIEADSLPSTVVYDGQVKEPQLVLTYAKDKNSLPEILEKGRDYELSYDNSREAGKSTVTVTGKGRFHGTMKKTFKILPFDAKTNADLKLQVEKGIEIAYAKGGAKPKPVVTFDGIVLTEGIDYTLTYSANKAVTKADTAKKPAVTVKFKGNFKGSLSESFTILPRDMGQLYILVQDPVFGKKKDFWKAKVTITDLDGKKLAAGKDYDKNLTYYTDEACQQPATAASYEEGTVLFVKAVGKGNYEGSSIVGSFRIVKSSVAKASVRIDPQYYTSEDITLDYEDITVKVSGKELKPETDYIIVEGSYTNNKNKGKASVTIQGVGENYGGYKTVKFSIKQKSVLFRWIPELLEMLK